MDPELSPLTNRRFGEMTLDCEAEGLNDSNVNNYSFYLSWRSDLLILLIVSHQGESLVCVHVCIGCTVCLCVYCF